MPEPFRILVASDGSPSSRAALDTVLAFPWPEGSLARGLVALNPLRGFHAATRSALVGALHDNSRALGEALARRWPGAKAKALHEPAAQAILGEARRFHASVVALGWRGQGGFRRLIAGSVSRRVAQRARCSVLVVRKDSGLVRRLVAGFNGSSGSRAAIRLVEALAAPRGNRVFLVHVLEPLAVVPNRLPARTRAVVRAELARRERMRRQQAERRLEASAARLRRKGWNVTTQVRLGAPVACLLEVSGQRSADAIVVGACGGSGLERLLLGSVAAGVLDRSPVPVLIAR